MRTRTRNLSLCSDSVSLLSLLAQLEERISELLTLVQRNGSQGQRLRLPASRAGTALPVVDVTPVAVAIAVGYSEERAVAHGRPGRRSHHKLRRRHFKMIAGWGRVRAPA